MAPLFGVTPVLEIARTAGMYDLAPTWTDLVAVGYQVERIEYVYGQGEEDDDEAGWMEVDVRNLDNAFDPTNTASPLYPGLDRDRQIRFRGTVGASTYTQWSGWIDRVEIDRSAVGLPMATIYAVDALGLLARLKTKDVGFRRKVMSLSPSAYWRLSDKDSDNIAIDETGNRRFAAYGLAGRQRTSTLLVADAEDSGADLSNNNFIVATSTVGLTGTAHSLFMLFSVEQLPAAGTNWTLVYQPTGSGNVFEIKILEDGAIQFSHAGTIFSTSPAGHVQTGVSMGLYFIRQGASWTIQSRRGNVSWTDTPTTTNWFFFPSWIVFGGYRSGADFLPNLNGAVDEIAVWSAVEVTSGLASVLNLALTPGNGESGSSRFGRVLDRISYPSSWRSTTISAYDELRNIFGTYRSAPDNLLTTLQILARTVSAQVYATRDRVLVYKGPSLPTVAGPTVTAAFDNTGTGIPIGSTLDVTLPDARTVGKLTASDGARSVSLGDTDAANERQFDVFPGQHEDLLIDAAQRLSRAYATPATVIDRLRVEMIGLANDPQKASVLALTRGHVIEVTTTDPTSSHKGEIRSVHGLIVETGGVPSEWMIEYATRPFPVTYVPAIRVMTGTHQTITTGILIEPTLRGERWDTDAMRSSVNPTDPSFGNTVALRTGDRYLLNGQAWWAGSATGGREAFISQLGGTGDIHAAMTDQGAGNGVAQQVGTLVQSPSDAALFRMEVRQSSGGNLSLFASVLGDPNWHFAPEMMAVRIPTDNHAVRATRTSALSTGNNSEGAVGFDGADRFDVGGLHNPATNNARLTAQRAGWWFIGAQLAFDADSSGHRIAAIRRNGGNNIGRHSVVTVAGLTVGVNGSSLWKMASGDYVEAIAGVHGASVSPLGSPLAGPSSPEFWAVELDGPGTRVTMTSAPGAGSFASGVYNMLTWTSERNDDAGWFAPSSTSITVDRDGQYLIWCNVEWESNSSGSRRLHIVLNDSIIIARREQTPITTTSTSMECWTLWDAKAGDVFGVQVWQDSGNNSLTLVKNGDHTPEFAVAFVATGP